MKVGLDVDLENLNSIASVTNAFLTALAALFATISTFLWNWHKFKIQKKQLELHKRQLNLQESQIEYLIKARDKDFKMSFSINTVKIQYHSTFHNVFIELINCNNTKPLGVKKIDLFFKDTPTPREIEHKKVYIDPMDFEKVELRLHDKDTNQFKHKNVMLRITDTDDVSIEANFVFNEGVVFKS
ncbi:MAG: hypothetical protein JW984_04385 [Deltaproteobacteria bacterium]|uniref:Uncharacterized protein n=1 Tax=Candidatus Zymogenus saltonus TaxID=2844893 RepID=A0A9D8PK16_9DELT|nr:hypothetical protein [Candidatus Zymogenus saltonus]